MAAVALLAVPALSGTQLAQDTVNVTITVTSYGAISGLPNPHMSFTVAGPYAGPLGMVYGDTDYFKVLCNVACLLTVTADQVSEDPSGAPATGPYPTATCTSGAAWSLGHRIGFTVQLANLDNYKSGVWNPVLEKAQVAFGPSMLGGKDLNAQIGIFSYMDWSRDGDALAPQGDYTATLTLTLAQAP